VSGDGVPTNCRHMHFDTQIFLSHHIAYTQAICSRRSGLEALSLSGIVLGCLRYMESNTNNISSAGLHGLDQRQRHSETSEEVDVRRAERTW